MQKAQKKDAVKTEKFWFRKDITTFSSPPACTACCQSSAETKSDADCYTLMTVDEIINGKVHCDRAAIVCSLNNYSS